MKATKRKLSRAEQIRRFLTANPNMPLKDVAIKFKTTYQIVYMIKRNMEGKALKTPKVVKTKPLRLTPAVKAQVIDDMIKEAENARKEMAITMIEPPADPVNHPAHYKVGGIETIDYIKAKLSPEEFRGYLKGNLLKYSSRIGHKGAAQIDAGKAGWYANALVQAIEENSKPT